MDDPVPQPLLERHCWVWGEWPPRGDPVPGVILGWHLQPKFYGTHSPWLLQVAVQRAPGNLVVEWVEGQRVAPVRDAGPGEPRRGVRHVWVRYAGTLDLPPHPGLLVDWRRRDGWEALVARADSGGSLLAAWEPAGQVVPIADDGWVPPGVDRLPKRSRRG